MRAQKIKTHFNTDITQTLLLHCLPCIYLYLYLVPICLFIYIFYLFTYFILFMLYLFYLLCIPFAVQQPRSAGKMDPGQHQPGQRHLRQPGPGWNLAAGRPE